MGSSADVKFTRWGGQEMEFLEMGIHEMGCSEDSVLRDREFRRWGAYEMGSSADVKFTK